MSRRPSRARLDSVLQPARQDLGQRAGDEAWSAGCALTLDEAIAEALSSGALVNGPTAQTRDGTRAPVLTRREEAVALRIALQDAAALQVGDHLGRQVAVGHHAPDHALRRRHVDGRQDHA